MSLLCGASSRTTTDEWIARRLGHALNFTVATIALVLQCIAWRLFVLPSSVRSFTRRAQASADIVRAQPVRMRDIKYLSTAMKTLLIGYGCDMLFSDLRPEYVLSPCLHS